jgi:predicted nucleotidyltransferase
MAKTRAELAQLIREYVAALEKRGVPVERIILYGSQLRGTAGEESDIDLAVFSDAFGPPDHHELSGVLSQAKWDVEPWIEAIGYHPSQLGNVRPISFLNEIVTTGEVIYRRGERTETRT